MENFSFLQLNNCFIRTLCKTSKLEEGEVIAKFDNIQVAGLDGIYTYKTAHGGYLDKPRVFWNSPKELNLNFTQGTFSKDQLSLCLNSKLYTKLNSEDIPIMTQEILESDENGIINLSHSPSSAVFVYDYDTGAKITFQLDGRQISILEKYKKVICNYEYFYATNISLIKVGQECYPGYVSLSAETVIKDESGIVTTGIIKIPRMKIVTPNLNIRLGKNTSPVAASFSALGIPTGSRGNEYIYEFLLLDTDLNSDF